ncbi:unnamed protein product [Aspergillus oryzae var. brunneus]|uniref:Unnamed protein product n=2 Tax=Aspergillus oryzae TaxID=5062 RepID=A0AAN4Z1D3_ASPOZ|nr:unnamed protein product [Aspergillus oryzae]GMG38646.1 unnamed protein product [Aspergillus oryzae]GMG46088.1 unnamed protein product [Aspergillus oryzae var. brunneus]
MSNNSEPPGATASGPAITDDNDARNDKLRLRCRMLEMEGLQDDNSLGPQAGLLFNRLICTGAVTPEVKEALVGHLNKEHRLDVWAFEDSPLDLQMLSRADKAIVVVREEATRSQPRCLGNV